jgi:ribosome-associated protein
VSETPTASPPSQSLSDLNVPSAIQLIVDALDDKRALDVAVLYLEPVSETLDWFVVATGEGSLQLRAMEDEIRDRLKSAKVPIRAVEGPSSRWVLMDYGSFVVHLMSPEAREFYDLEGLWADAPRVELSAS